MRTLSTIFLAFAVLVSGAAFGQDSASDFVTLEAEHDKEWSAWRERRMTRQRDGATPEAIAKINAEDPTALYFTRFEAGAARHQGTPDAVPYLEWLVRWGARGDRKDAASKALDRLVQGHLANPALQDMAISLAISAQRFGFDRAKTLTVLRQIAEVAKKPETKANTLYWRSYVVGRTPSSKAERTEACKDLAFATEHGEARTRTSAEGLLFELQNLQVGMVAPDIEGEDLGGVKFKLSDYRGKVVLLDFWGDW